MASLTAVSNLAISLTPSLQLGLGALSPYSRVSLRALRESLRKGSPRRLLLITYLVTSMEGPSLSGQPWT
jgi:hypothetical protein